MAPAIPRRSASVHLTLISQDEVLPRDAEHVLTAAFTAKDYGDCIKDLDRCEIDPQAYIDGLDRVIDTLSSSSKNYRRGLRALRKVCGIYGLLPSSYIKPEPLTLVIAGPMKRPFASGGYADVWKASDPDGCVFAVKQLRIYIVDNIEHVKKNFCKEVIICRRIQHENVLSMEGVAPGLFEICMVSKWMDNGNMLQYVKSQQKVDRTHLLIGITRGLHHLHSNEVIHGDLKGPNILIDWQGNPLLADFGLSSITKNSTSVNASTPHVAGGTIRWSAPELLDGLSDKNKRQNPTTESDIYALSMVVVELYSGDIPFPGFSDPTVILVVSRGGRPPKPALLGLTPAVWELTVKCWQKKAEKRPGTSELLAHLEGMSSGECAGDLKRRGKAIPASRLLLERAKRFLSRHALPTHRRGQQT